MLNENVRRDAIQIAKNKIVDINVNDRFYKQNVIEWIEANPALTDADAEKLIRAAKNIQPTRTFDDAKAIQKLKKKSQLDPYSRAIQENNAWLKRTLGW